MKKLLQINIVSNILSTGTICEDIAKVAQNRGWDTYVAYGRTAITGVSKEIKIGSFCDEVLHYLESRIFDREGLSSRRSTKNLISIIDKIKPDVIHLHNIHDHYLNYKILFEYLNRTDIKVVWTFHDFWAITGHCHHFIDAFCEKWKKGCGHCPLLHSTVNSLFDRSERNYLLKKDIFTANNNLTIVPVSEWVGSNVKESFLKDKPIRVIPNGIDIDIYKPLESESWTCMFKGKFLILAVAREWNYGDRKGLDEFLKLSKFLKKDEIIVLVGMSNKLINEMPDNIVGLPRISVRSELVSLYTRAEVLVSLSSAETFGLTVIEANACGTPAIVYNNTAPPSLIDEDTGYIAVNKDIADVYGKICLIRNNGKNFYKDKCITYARSKYNKNNNYSAYINLYEELLLR